MKLNNSWCLVVFKVTEVGLGEEGEEEVAVVVVVVVVEEVEDVSELIGMLLAGNTSVGRSLRPCSIQRSRTRGSQDL